MNRDIREGGNTIEYRDEDPEIRRAFEESLLEDEGQSNMPKDLYG